MIAKIYSLDGNILSDGLQGSQVSDEAIQIARRTANERNESVQLVDDDGEWEVCPDGSVKEWSA